MLTHLFHTLLYDAFAVYVQEQSCEAIFALVLEDAASAAVIDGVPCVCGA